MKKITILMKKELTILEESDLEDINKVLKKLYHENLLDEILIVDSEKKLTNLPYEFFNEALREVNNLKKDVDNLKKEFFELKEMLKDLIITVREISSKLYEEE
jgi:hypothetical protein